MKIRKIKISQEQNKIFFTIEEDGIYDIEVKNINGDIIYQKNNWEIFKNIEYFVKPVSTMNTPEITIIESLPKIKSIINYEKNILSIKCLESINLVVSIFDEKRNILLKKECNMSDRSEFWFSPKIGFSNYKNITVHVENKHGKTLHINHFNLIDEFSNFNSKRFIFCHIPKSAGTSIKASLGINIPDHEVFYKSENSNYSFAFVRNPYDRFLSSYFYLRNGGLSDLDKKDFEIFNGNSDLDEFIKKKLSNSLSQRHFKPQCQYIPNGVDFLGKYENLKEDFDKMCEIMKLDRRELPHENKTKTHDYKLTDEQKEILYDVYKEDFLRFGYDK